MRNLIITCFAALCSLSAFAANNWTVYFQNESIKISYHLSECRDATNGIYQQKVLFKFENTSATKEEISFNKRLVYGEKTAGDDVASYKIVLQPNQVIEGDCSTHDNRLFIFSKHLDFKGAELTHFDLKNITVKPLE